ncbi:MAG TPA: heme-binding protein [Caulifigura sp.]|nr:heme-binding protein [Caulifigura sp.]
MIRLPVLLVASALVVSLFNQPVNAQQPIPEYGPSVTIEQAKKAIAAAEVEAKKHNWPVAIAVVDTHGFLVAFEKLDQTQYGSVDLSIEKAKTSALYRRPTKAFEDLIAEGGRNMRLTRHPAMIIEGGIPLTVDGKIVGAIGVSGVKSEEDAVVAQAGADALKPAPK